jgi:hypothetical protein
MALKPEMLLSLSFKKQPILLPQSAKHTYRQRLIN